MKIGGSSERPRRGKATEKVTFTTIPTEFGGREHFKYHSPNFVAEAVQFNGRESITLPGVVDARAGVKLSFDLPDDTVDALQQYVNESFHSNDVRGCYHFLLRTLGAERVNYQEAAKMLNASIGERVEDVSTFLPGEPILIAHPGFTYKDFDGMDIDHAAIALDDTYCLQIGRVSGPLVVARYDTMLAHNQRIFSTVSERIPGIWVDNREPTPEDIQWHRVDFAKLAEAFRSFKR